MTVGQKLTHGFFYFLKKKEKRKRKKEVMILDGLGKIV